MHPYNKFSHPTPYSHWRSSLLAHSAIFNIQRPAQKPFLTLGGGLAPFGGGATKSRPLQAKRGVGDIQSTLTHPADDLYDAIGVSWD